jgi:hypothetical protein
VLTYRQQPASITRTAHRPGATFPQTGGRQPAKAPVVTTLASRLAKVNTIKESRMQRIKTAGLALLAILALTAITATTASAETKPEFGGKQPASVTSKNVSGTEAKFFQKEGLATITCKSYTDSGTIITKKQGTFDILFLECTAPLAGKCTGLNDTTKGSILALGTFHLRYIAQTPTKDVGIAFLIKPVHFECEKLVELVEVRGCVVGLITPINIKTKTTIITLHGNQKGQNDFTQILNEGGTVNEPCKLESEFNGGSFRQSDQENTDEQTVTTAEEIIA